VAVLHGHPSDAVAVASPVGGEALDVHASGWPPTDATRGARAGTPSCAREPGGGINGLSAS
jgi:hypothetical protein